MKALIVYGGWDGHQPQQVAQTFEKALKAKGAQVEMSDSLDVLVDGAKLASLDVIIPHWTMGKMTGEQWTGLSEAIRSGVGLAGMHGGMGDAFRESLDFQWMVGGQFVGHPHVGDYQIRLTGQMSKITAPLPTHMAYKSEQYYQLVDPGVNVLADTLYEFDGRRTIMPCIWTKAWGKGRVFYSALGHSAQEFVDYPAVLEMTVNGIIWAAEGKKLA